MLFIQNKQVPQKEDKLKKYLFFANYIINIVKY